MHFADEKNDVTKLDTWDIRPQGWATIFVRGPHWAFFVPRGPDSSQLCQFIVNILGSILKVEFTGLSNSKKIIFKKAKN